MAKNVAQSLNDLMGLDLSAAMDACAVFFQNSWRVLGFILILTVFLVFLIYRSISKRLHHSFKEVDMGLDVLIEGNSLESVRLSPEMSFLEGKMAALKQAFLDREKGTQQDEQRKSRLGNRIAQEIKASLSFLTKDQGLFGDESLMSFDQKSKYVGYSQEKARELDDLVTSFLEITCSEDVLLSKEVIDINQMFSKIIEEIQPLLTAQNKDAVLNAEEKSMIFGNQERISRAFNTILKNAVAYSEVVSAIYIEALVKGYQTRIRITSRGKTMPANVLKVMADNYYAYEDTLAMVDKNGLGLVIARESISRHNGTLTAESEDGKTTFTIDLPLPAEYGLSRGGNVGGFQEQSSYAMGNEVAGGAEEYGQHGFGYSAMGQAPTPRPEYGQSEYGQGNMPQADSSGVRRPGGYAYGDEPSASQEPMYSQSKDLGAVSRSTEYPPQDSQSGKPSLESRMSEYLQGYAEDPVPQGSGYTQDQGYRSQDIDNVGPLQPKYLQDNKTLGARLSETAQQEREEDHRSSPYGEAYERVYAGAKTGAPGAASTSYKPGYSQMPQMPQMPQMQDNNSFGGRQPGYTQDNNVRLGSHKTEYPQSQERRFGSGKPEFGQHEEAQTLSLYEPQYEEELAKDKGKRKDKDKDKAKAKTKLKIKDKANIDAGGAPLYGEGYPQGDNLGGVPRRPEYPQADSGFGFRPGDISQLSHSQDNSGFGSRQPGDRSQPGYSQENSGFGVSRQPEYPQADSGFGASRQPEYPQADSSFGVSRQPEYPQADSGFGASRQPEYPQADSGFGASRQPEYPQADSSFGASRQPEYPQADSSFGASRQPEYPQADSGFGSPRRQESPQADSGAGSRPSEYSYAGSGLESRQMGYSQENSELILPRQPEYPRVSVESLTPQGQEYAGQGPGGTHNTSRQQYEGGQAQVDVPGGIAPYDEGASFGGIVPYGEIAPYSEVRARSDFYNSAHDDKTIQIGMPDSAQRKTPNAAEGYPQPSQHKQEMERASHSQGDPYGFLTSQEETQLSKTENRAGEDTYGRPKYLHKRSYAPDGAYEPFPIKRGHESIHRYSENGRQKG
ncbi:MAG: ATP-binding protein [Peptococcaceae bacterium]|nr:ATP-binding protein [Peptococcaceae bacterium]